MDMMTKKCQVTIDVEIEVDMDGNYSSQTVAEHAKACALDVLSKDLAHDVAQMVAKHEDTEYESPVTVWDL